MRHCRADIARTSFIDASKLIACHCTKMDRPIHCTVFIHPTCNYAFVQFTCR